MPDYVLSCVTGRWRTASRFAAPAGARKPTRSTTCWQCDIACGRTGLKSVGVRPLVRSLRRFRLSRPGIRAEGMDDVHPSGFVGRPQAER
jgi:hypothetical protein